MEWFSYNPSLHSLFFFDFRVFDNLREPLVRRQGSQVSMRVYEGERVLALESREGTRASRRDGDLSLPLGLALGSPIFPSGCEGTLGVGTGCCCCCCCCC